MRIKSTWFKEGRQHTPQELAGAVAFVAWRIADDALKATRKADFEVAVGPQYFAFFNEFLIFLVQVADRIAYRRLDGEARAMFTGTAKPMPTLPPEGDQIAVFTPITRPVASKSGPPELPRLMGASIWR